MEVIIYSAYREALIFISAWIYASFLGDILKSCKAGKKNGSIALISVLFLYGHLIYVRDLRVLLPGIIIVSFTGVFLLPLFFQMNKKQRIFFPFFLLILQIVSTVSAYFLSELVVGGKGEVVSGQNTYTVWPGYLMPVGILGSMILIMLTMFICAWIKYYIQGIKCRELILFLIVPTYQVLLMICYFWICVELNAQTLLMGILLLGLSEVINRLIVRNINNMLQKEQLQKEIQKLYTQREGERDYQKLNDSYEKEIRAMQMKFAGQLSEAYVMLDAGEDYEKVRQTLDEAYQHIRASKGIKYCDNAVVNSVFVLKKKLAEEKKIPMKISAFVKEDIQVEALDLCSLFCNLLDNAIEACDRINDPQIKKYVTVSADCRSGYLILKVRNSSEHSPEMINGIFQTSKLEDKQLHGLGLKLVKKIVDMYAGKLEISDEKGSFMVTAILKADGKEKNE